MSACPPVRYRGDHALCGPLLPAADRRARLRPGRHDDWVLLEWEWLRQLQLHPAEAAAAACLQTGRFVTAEMTPPVPPQLRRWDGSLMKAPTTVSPNTVVVTGAAARWIFRAVHHNEADWPECSRTRL
ncbi:hypothetical protein FDG2_2326 [Candidatus Protofrankia californiensis]|uniref:Uncharacterized protein n=1 Tax=Candidatus Protofrankia californiensis TaxID=1839754 RepID=A0A1C3NXG0_9ACTN|nr:hypothetical protein FDG2_2326 [Candidatus Protofrankia californiensis]